MLVIPFWLMIRGAVFLYEYYGWHPSLAIVALAGIVGFILLVYVTMLWDWLFGVKHINRTTIKIKVGIVLVFLLTYTGFTLYYLSGKNAKSEEVRKEYKSLHPFLRMAVGTWIWMDGDLLVTDGARRSGDYARMGLPENENSLHYRQVTGYVHAMDLRTRTRGEIRNWLMKTYFQMLGFNTLRHTGTADHLHVSLSLRGSQQI